ncbi:EAL domain-containing protein [Phormidesmis priestleyi ULC007]|uniref:EAL domain-containing protein n=1 Tax=Phormidesmis priestleyi ULC007 TaxID=1920490 RepID=A0A2T1D7Z6_9CYAN|nr:EAL domain-containing protein [Phormidesmis priestleyi]PSB16557.1 EAL domain-containing protein [Phormidesmis priestleyi ULC007]PZO47410.1 MAG: EAL domain-containing protein [Phormidesmis priestleyi]
MNLLDNSLKLIIQPDSEATEEYIYQLGFQKITLVPQLLYQVVINHQLPELLSQISQMIPEASQTSVRFLLTRSPLESRDLLVEFLNAQPLSNTTRLIKNAWFLQVLARQRLFFKYQPIFNLASGQVVAHECLARAKTSQGQSFGGQQLIDAALSMNLLNEFDDLARSSCLEAVAQISAKVGSAESSATFFINVLPNAIGCDPRSLERNFQQVLDLGLRPEQIVFELTEIEALGRYPALPRLIEQIRAWGFGLAIDDLGSNVSIDHYCMEFRPDVIKLDRRLIHGCSHYTLKQVMIKSLLHFAHEMEIVVLAEGLEDANDIEFCSQAGVDLGQGFGLASPELTLWQPSDEQMLEAC